MLFKHYFRSRRIAVRLMLAALAVLPCLPSNAQKLALSYNVGDAVLFGTVGVGADYALSQKWSIDAEVRFNPWTFHAGDAGRQAQWRHQTYAVGMRFWPWYVHSGFWAGALFQYQEYNRGGFFGDRITEEGDAFGLCLEAGYSWMLSHSINVNVGVGGWGGYTFYRSYECPRCGRLLEAGGKPFVLANRFILAVEYVF